MRWLAKVGLAALMACGNLRGEDTGPWTWWHWVDGNLAPNGSLFVLFHQGKEGREVTVAE